MVMAQWDFDKVSLVTYVPDSQCTLIWLEVILSGYDLKWRINFPEQNHRHYGRELPIIRGTRMPIIRHGVI